MEAGMVVSLQSRQEAKGYIGERRAAL